LNKLKKINSNQFKSIQFNLVPAAIDVGVDDAVGLIEAALRVHLDTKVALRLDAASLLEGEVLVAVVVGEAPLAGDNNLLAAGELVLGAAEGLEDVLGDRVLTTDGEENLTNLDAGGKTLGLTKGTTHTGLQTIGTGARKHLVDAEHVEGMHADAHVEGVLATHLGDVLVAGNAGSLERLGGDLLLLVRDQMGTEREVVDGGTLLAEIEDFDLGVGDTTAETRLDVRLVLAIAIALQN